MVIGYSNAQYSSSLFDSNCDGWFVPESFKKKIYHGNVFCAEIDAFLQSKNIGNYYFTQEAKDWISFKTQYIYKPDLSSWKPWRERIHSKVEEKEVTNEQHEFKKCFIDNLSTGSIDIV